jgi:hypothetical protein
MELPIIQFSPPSRHLIPLGYKYSPQHPAPKHIQSVLFPSRERLKFHAILNTT